VIDINSNVWDTRIMKKLTMISGVFLTVLFASPAFADVTLTNKDSVSHDISIQCGGGGGTTQTSISSNTTRSIGSGPCKVTDKETGATYSGEDGDTITINAGKH
jgi:hypothetical protein